VAKNVINEPCGRCFDADSASESDIVADAISAMSSSNCYTARASDAQRFYRVA